MSSQARVLMGGIAAVLLLGIAVWAWSPRHHGTVEIKQLDPDSWAVQTTELGAVEKQETAAAH